MHFREKDGEINTIKNKTTNITQVLEYDDKIPEETLRMVYIGIALLVMILAVFVTLLINKKEIYIHKQYQ